MGGEKLKPSRPYTGVLFAIIVLALSLFTSTPSLSAQSNDPAPVATPFEDSTFFFDDPAADTPIPGGASVFVIIRMVLVLALSALAIYGVFFFVKRAAKPQENRDPHLKVLARVPLSNDTFAAVISVGAKAWLVSGGSGSVNLISEISDNESLETMLLDDAKRSATSGTKRYFDFASLLRRFGSSQEGKDQSGNSFAAALRKQRERLRRL